MGVGYLFDRTVPLRIDRAARGSTCPLPCSERPVAAARFCGSRCHGAPEAYRQQGGRWQEAYQEAEVCVETKRLIDLCFVSVRDRVPEEGHIQAQKAPVASARCTSCWPVSTPIPRGQSFAQSAVVQRLTLVVGVCFSKNSPPSPIFGAKPLSLFDCSMN